ncbi:MAG: hypothetical protein MI923_03255 [Phycisphaerales bacterium]|nr:hypothetical protein [Phycisphaerales bacterium]
MPSPCVTRSMLLLAPPTVASIMTSTSAVAASASAAVPGSAKVPAPGVFKLSNTKKLTPLRLEMSPVKSTSSKSYIPLVGRVSVAVIGVTALIEEAVPSGSTPLPSPKVKLVRLVVDENWTPLLVPMVEALSPPLVSVSPSWMTPAPVAPAASIAIVVPAAALLVRSKSLAVMPALTVAPLMSKPIAAASFREMSRSVKVSIASNVPEMSTPREVTF